MRVLPEGPRACRSEAREAKRELGRMTGPVARFNHAHTRLRVICGHLLAQGLFGHCHLGGKIEAHLRGRLRKTRGVKTRQLPGGARRCAGQTEQTCSTAAQACASAASSPPHRGAGLPSRRALDSDARRPATPVRAPDDGPCVGAIRRAAAPGADRVLSVPTRKAPAGSSTSCSTASASIALIAAIGGRFRHCGYTWSRAKILFCKVRGKFTAEWRFRAIRHSSRQEGKRKWEYRWTRSAFRRGRRWRRLCRT